MSYDYTGGHWQYNSTDVMHLGSDITVDKIDSQSATSGQVLTANGSGGASWQDAPIPVGVQYKDNATIQANPLKFVKMTNSQYTALQVKDADTFYIVIPDPVPTLVFNIYTFDNVFVASHQAEVGMTWSQWVSSDYNTSGAFIDQYNNVWYNNSAVITDGTGAEKASDVIVAMNYILD